MVGSALGGCSAAADDLAQADLAALPLVDSVAADSAVPAGSSSRARYLAGRLSASQAFQAAPSVPQDAALQPRLVAACWPFRS